MESFREPYPSDDNHRRSDRLKAAYLFCYMLSEGVHENSNERVWLELRAKISFFENAHFLKNKK